MTVTTSGVADAAGFCAFNDELVEHPQYQPGMAVLIDHTGLDATLLTTADIEAIAAHSAALEKRYGDSPVALIVPDAFTFGLARMSVRRARFERLTPQTFASREEALEWLRAQKH